MLSPTQQREHEAHVAQVREYMRTRKLSIEDLIEIGGQDLRSPHSAQCEKARRVENCWALMARLGVKHPDLGDWAPAAVPTPAFRLRGRRGGGGFLQPIENTTERPVAPQIHLSNEIKGLADSARIGVLEFGVSNAEPAEIAAEKMKARFAAMGAAP
jgi:hypothetical protein